MEGEQKEELRGERLALILGKRGINETSHEHEGKELGRRQPGVWGSGMNGILRRTLIDSPRKDKQTDEPAVPKWTTRLPRGTTSHFAISIRSWRRGQAAQKTTAPPLVPFTVQ